MKFKSQFHLAATIRMGGAANGVIAPPMLTFTNKVPMIPYLNLFEIFFE